MAEALDNSVKLSDSVYNAIKAEGKMGDSFDDILRRKYGLPERSKA